MRGLFLDETDKSHARKTLSRKAPHGAIKQNSAGRTAGQSRRTARGGAAMSEQELNEGAGGEHGDATGDVDYKALYEKAKEDLDKQKSLSRGWERKAKANKDAAKQLEEAQEAGKSAEEQIADLKKRLDAKEKAEERAKLAAKVADKKGVPADLLVGDDEESMDAYADKLLKHFQKKPAPKMKNPGKFDHGGDGDSELRGFARKLLGSE